MTDLLFSSVGVDVENYTPKDLHRLFIENGLDMFITPTTLLSSDTFYFKGKYLQSECRGTLTDITKLSVLSGFVNYTTSMQTYLLILSTALLDMDTANELIHTLYYEGLIKPRNN